MSDQKEPLTRAEEEAQYEEQKRRLNDIMHRDGERRDWDAWWATFL